MLTKSKLAITLSKLKTFENPDLQSEQYATDSESAALILWNAFMNGDVEGKAIADFGAGTGILGIGCLLLGAKSVYFVERDREALAVAEQNLAAVKEKINGNYELMLRDVRNAEVKADVIIQNPPFGTKTAHADREFLLQAFEAAPVVYSFHKTATALFVERLAAARGFSVTNRYGLSLPLKQQHSFHKRKIHRVEVSCFRMERT